MARTGNEAVTARDARALGLTRRITRRDFLNGVAVGTAGFTACRLGDPILGLAWRGAIDGQAPVAPEIAPDYYPPALTGLRGQHPGSFEAAHQARDGAFFDLSRLRVTDTGEEYDLVVVGGGISGLAAAHFYRQALGFERRVLILDNHDDVGGHAKRNEFRYRGRLYIGYGGTQSISTPFPYSFTAKALIRDLGIQVERYPEFLDRDLYRRLGLTRGLFFDREHFGEDRLVTGYGTRPWPEFFAEAPLTEQARRDLVRLYVEAVDYLAGLTTEEKLSRLARMSYQDYLATIARVTPEALPYFAGMAGRNNKRADTMPALEAAESGWPGFQGLKLPLQPRWESDRYTFHFPDGGATVVRLLVNRLVPAALPEGTDMERVTLARLDYAKLDVPGAPVRIRLNSTVVRVVHDGPPDRARAVRVIYVRGGRLFSARARAAVLACFSSMIPSLVPELPQEQRAALAYGVKVPMLYTNVFVRHWHSFVKLGVQSVAAPALYYTSFALDFPVSIGRYECPKTPDAPIIIHMVRNPNRPGLPRREQHKAGMRELLTTPFERIELETRRELARVLGPGGFDPAADIVAITANRWPHGYAYTYDTLADPDVPEAERPHVRARRPFGLLAIANSDAGAAAFINVAIDEAHRAVQDLLARQGLR